MPVASSAPFQRFEVVGTTPHRHELEGVEWLRATLPDYDPYAAWALFSFGTDDGRRYEIDAIALTSHCLYVIELKSWSGAVVEGDQRYLVTSSKERGRQVVPHPLPLLEVKTKNLIGKIRRVASRMDREVSDALAHLWAEPLVWLTHADKKGTTLTDDSAALSHVLVGRASLGDALRQAKFPGARDDLAAKSTTRATLKALRKVFRHPELGLTNVIKARSVLNGSVTLTDLLDEGDDYQDHLGEPAGGIGPKRRVRSYLAPKSDRSHVSRLESRVEREAKVLTRLGDHPYILALDQFDRSGPLGPALVFRGFDGKALDAFLKEQRDAEGRSTIAIDDKLTILRRVAEALSFCHREELVHGAISPEAVLVVRVDGGRLEVRLTRFALAAGNDPVTEGSRLFTRLAGTSAGIYQAPEVALGARATIESDLFSFGALAYFLLSETAPAESSSELTRRLHRERGLSISAVRDDLFPPDVPKEIGKDVDQLIFEATLEDPSQRTQTFSSALELVDLLEDVLTRPLAASPPVEAEPARVEANPLDATKGTVLNGGLLVMAVLGSGATARVFKVRDDKGDEAALKMPLSEAHDERIRREGAVLERLRRTSGVDRIAHLIETRNVAGRVCLLLQLAGDKTLADEIRAEGSVSLEYAARWGDDLLTALRSLEEAGVQHRDIKPANIGLTSGASKGPKRLLLFDFSLSDHPAEDLAIGTPAYRDPQLHERGRWDDAADRWAAAITLHEMFTGVRPAPVMGATGGMVAVRVESDRIDPGVRDRLTPFLSRALQWSATDRFATADDMKEALRDALRAVSAPAGQGIEPASTELDLKGLGPEARVADLPLLPRERNGLDRMGIYTLHELAQLNTKRLFAVRGVGAHTMRALVDLANRVRAHLEISASEPTPFLRGFAGSRVPVEGQEERGGPGRVLALRLMGGGLVDSVTVAAAPETQVKNLISRAKRDGASESAKELTHWLEKLVDAEQAPATLGAAVQLLAGKPTTKPSASRQRVRQYLGLEDLDGFPRHGTMSELSRATGFSRALVSIDLGKARERWTRTGSTGSLVDGAASSPTREVSVLRRAYGSVAGALAASAGVLPIARAAAAITDAFPPEPDLSPDAIWRASEAMVRALTEIDPEDVGEQPLGRLRLRKSTARASVEGGSSGSVLIAVDRSAFDLADAMGAEADRWVDKEGVVAETAAAARLREVLEANGRLERERAASARSLPDRALVSLAVATAARACLSARGELYVLGLEAERAVVLSVAALTSRIPREELRRRVRARYPDSAPLPDDPEGLQGIAKQIGMRFDAADDAFVPLERSHTLASTEMGTRGAQVSTASSPARDAPAATPSRPARVASPAMVRDRPATDVAGAGEIKRFEVELDRCSREGLFRVLLWRGQRATAERRPGVGAPNDEPVAKAVAKRIGGETRWLDALLIDAAEKIAVEKKLRGGLDVAIAADAAGPDGASWPRLLELMQLAASRAFSELREGDQPRVLLRLGLLARYELLRELGTLAQAHRGGTATATPNDRPRPAMFVVLPVFPGERALVEVAEDVAPRVGAAAGTLLVPLPGVLPHEILELPSAWADVYSSKSGTSSSALVAQRIPIS